MGRIILPNGSSNEGVGEDKEKQFHNVLVAIVTNSILYAASTGKNVDMANAERVVKDVNSLFVQTATQVWVTGFMEKQQYIYEELKKMYEQPNMDSKNAAIWRLQEKMTEWQLEFQEAVDAAQENYTTLCKQLKIDNI
jgi:hypothetical protein